jgi:DNA invertase Pin-like site-specific DNA recombinase
MVGQISGPIRSAFGYVRVSTEEQAREGLSLEAQRQRITTACAFQGLVLADVLVGRERAARTSTSRSSRCCWVV